MKKISILGSTGSIGTQALEVVRGLSEKVEIIGLSGGSNLDLLEQQVKEFNPEFVCVKDENLAKEFKTRVENVEILSGKDGLCHIAENPQNDNVLVAVSGVNGLFPTLCAIEAGNTVSIANKETLVMAGNVVMDKAKQKNVMLLPVDSEHSAIHQSVRKYSDIRKLIITASGGPFRNSSREEIANAKVSQTLAHPKWSMGSKITVDSATLMNKGLEVIEAHWLFGVEYQDIEVVIHPQSIIHSAVEHFDGSVIAQLGVPSMHIPIQYALTYPDRVEGIKTDSFSLAKIARLDFEEPDYDRFPCLRLAFEAGKMAGTATTLLNAVNEEVVMAYLEEKAKLSDIPKTVEDMLNQHSNTLNPTLDEIIEVDVRARAVVREKFQTQKGKALI